MNENSYHEKFLLYLESLHSLDEASRLEIVKIAEERLPALLLSYGIVSNGNIYKCLDANLLMSVKTDDLIDSNSTKEEMRNAGLTMRSLKYFKGFIIFNKTANYKKLFNLQAKRERGKLSLQAKNEVSTNFSDSTLPEKENTPRTEGSVSQVCVTHYERNPKDRQKALDKYGYVCQVCGMNFEEVYGEIGKNFIEVHHLYPVCNMGEHYEFDPLDEKRGLIPICSNCHSMIHRGGKTEIRNGKQVMIPMSLKELREIYLKKNKK